MKKIIEVDSKTEGLEALLGENVVLICVNYIYAGKLVGVNETFVQLDGAAIVYETGEWTCTTWKDAQRLPSAKWQVRTSAVESWGVSGR